MLRVVFRCDASPEIGYGHLMRSIALAECLVAYGDDVSFLIREDEGADRVLREAGMRAAWLPGTCGLDGLAEAISREGQRLRASGHEPLWFVVDSYEQPEAQSAHARRAGASVLVLDDVGRWSGDAQCLVNPNLDAEASWYPAVNGTKLLLGAPYVLLRREFRDIPRIDASKPVRRLLMTAGGSDRYNRTALFLSAVSHLPEAQRAQLKVHIVYGHGYKHDKVTIQTKLANPSPNDPWMDLSSGLTRISDVMRDADLAISGAGGTLYELAYLGIPTLAVVLSENQARNAEAFARRGLAVSLGRADEIAAESIAKALERLIANPGERVAISVRGRELIDGRGAERVRHAMETYP